MGMTIAGAGQVVDSLILQPINPAANGSACPGQNVTFNCTAVRSMQAAVDIIMTLSYKGTVIVSNSGTSTVVGVFTAEFINGDISVMSDITIFSVPLSHHNSEIRCETTFAPFETSRIKVAGACMTMTIPCMHICILHVQARRQGGFGRFGRTAQATQRSA